MERLTNADHEEMGFFAYAGPKNPYSVPLTIGELAELPNIKYSPREILEEVFARLAAYEDTGLEPEEIRELCTDDVAKIAKLFRHMIEDGSIDHLQALMEAEKDGRLVVLPCKVGDTIYQLRKPGHARGPGVSPRIVSCIEIRGRDYAVCHQGMEPCLKRDLGKTWFLTLQEAEEALRKEAENG